MIIDVSTGNSGKWVLGKIPMFKIVDMGFEDLKQIKSNIFMYQGPWLEEATRSTRIELNSDTKELIEEAKREVEKAKQLMKQVPFLKRWYYLVKNKFNGY